MVIDQETVRQDISRMISQDVQLDRSLNLDYGLAGDEVQSLFERLCNKYNVDIDCLWEKIDFDRYFRREFHLVEFVFVWISYKLGNKPKTKTGEEPFMIHDLVQILRSCQSK